MKIVIATESYPPAVSGVAVATSLLADRLADAGHDVWVFAPATRFGNSVELDRHQKRLILMRFRSIKNPFRDTHRISFLARRAIRRAYATIEPDIVHLQDPNAIAGTTLKEAVRAKTPIVVTNHFAPEFVLAYLWFLGPAKPLARRRLLGYLKRFYNKTNIVITPTQSTADIVTSWGITTPVRAISNGVAVERFFPGRRDLALMKQWGLPTDRPIILYVGRIDRDKSLSILIRAFRLITEKRPAHLVLTGDGDRREVCEKLVRALGLTNAVTFTGSLAHQSVALPRLYRLATVFAIPSTIETQSIVTLEAMASGLPVVAARAGALTDLVEDDVTGCLFSPGDAADCAAKILSVLADRGLAARLARAGVKKIAPHRLNRVHQEIITLYEQLVATA